MSAVIRLTRRLFGEMLQRVTGLLGSARRLMMGTAPGNPLSHN